MGMGVVGRVECCIVQKINSCTFQSIKLLHRCCWEKSQGREEGMVQSVGSITVHNGAVCSI